MITDINHIFSFSTFLCLLFDLLKSLSVDFYETIYPFEILISIPNFFRATFSF